MENAYTGFVSRAEWRWVIFISLTLVLVVLSPLAIVAFFKPADSDWRFLGAIHQHIDAASGLARMQQGVDGAIMSVFAHTPESNAGALVNPLYTALGRLSQILNVPTIIMFHVARIMAAFFMYVSIYQLGASIWIRIRTRRIFFVLASISSGIGWLIGLFRLLPNISNIPDLESAQLYPFFATAVNIHVPLAIGFLSLLVAVILPILRPGDITEPHVTNGGITVFLANVGLAFILPDSLVPFSVALIGILLLQSWQARSFKQSAWLWVLWSLVPALPIIVYDLLTISSNPFVAEWIHQRSLLIPPFVLLVTGLAIPLLIAIPGLYRAFRYFEPDGDQFMLVWLFAMVALCYLPLSLGDMVMTGIMIPLAYFATRSVEDFWFAKIKRRYWGRIYVATVPPLVLSHLVWLFMPVFPLLQGWSIVKANVLSTNYLDAMILVNEYARPDDVVLTSPSVGAWIPVWAGARPVYGHPTETYEADQKRLEVETWFALDESEISQCADLITNYGVDFVIVGHFERQLGQSVCLAEYPILATYGDVVVYSITNP